MRRAVFSLASIGFSASFLGPFVAQAQNVGAADALFQRGVAAMMAGDLETACPIIADSQKLDPHPGTLFTLAECEAKRGHVATASVEYGDYLAQTDDMPVEQRARHEERRKIAKKQALDLARNIPSLTLLLPSGSKASLRLDGAALGTRSLGVALPVDPGAHVVTVVDPDGQEREITLRISPGDHTRWEAPSSAPPHASAPPLDASAPTRERSDGARSTRATVAYAVGGVGLATVAAGAVIGVLAIGKKSTVDDHCVGTACDSTGKNAGDSAKTLGDLSTLVFAVGFAAVGTSAFLLLTGQKDSATSGWQLEPEVSPRLASLRVRLSF